MSTQELMQKGFSYTLQCVVFAQTNFCTTPMIIFKSVRWSDTLKENSLSNSLLRLSPKGWINGELFLNGLNSLLVLSHLYDLLFYLWTLTALTLELKLLSLQRQKKSTS